MRGIAVRINKQKLHTTKTDYMIIMRKQHWSLQWMSKGKLPLDCSITIGLVVMELLHPLDPLQYGRHQGQYK